jgi:hypothetical protein
MARRGAIIFAVLVLLCSAPAMAEITCEECKELELQQQQLREEMREIDDKMSSAIAKNKYRLIRDLNAKLTDLRGQELSLQKQTEGCEQACRADVVKERQCERLAKAILDKDTGDDLPPEELAEVDRMYKELKRCHDEAERLGSR